MKKRITAAILSIACIASLIGCGKENAGTETKESTSNEVSVEASVDAEVVEDVKDVVETVVESVVEEAKEPEMVPGKTKDNEGRTFMGGVYTGPYAISQDEQYNGWVSMHCYEYSWCLYNEDGTYAGETVYTYSEPEPCEFPDKENWTYTEVDGITVPERECFECTKCGRLDEGSYDYHFGKALTEAGKTQDGDIYTKRSQQWIETKLAPIEKETYSIRE